MLGVSASVVAAEESIKSHDQRVTQISLSSSHSLILYNERQLYGCPHSRKELFGNWVEGESGFCLIKFGEEIDKIFKVLAANCGTVILCFSRIDCMKELYSFGLPGSPVLGQGENQFMEEYNRLEYPP